ncbi:MAG: acetoacetate--CoA ligase [Gammaproteobacteria bacterium]|nr:acetoacetate--CoA ligase [Gammaproteobacteria bacterium]
MTAFTRAAERATNLQFADYDALWRWSIDDSERFWSLLWDFCDVIGERGQRTVLNRERMPGARWFPDARLNLAENLLRDDFPASQLAVVFWGEDRVRRSLTRGDLRQHVAKMAAAMRAAGVGVGDRVAALLPNIPETLVITLAALSLGAIVTTTSPDFGVQGVLDRFGQTRPKLLFAVDGYWYNRKRIDCLTKTRTIAAQLADLTACIVVPYLDTLPNVDGIAHGLLLEDFLRGHANTTRLDFIRLPFDHPAYVLYSSGTTGLPKGIVHSAGGILLQHLKEHQLHCDIHAGDRFFYFTTCGWMMWNYLISGLASGASLLLYDGSPLLDQGRILFRFADAERMTHLGTSAKWIDTIAKNGLAPRREFHLDAVRVIMSTGSPLAPESFDYVYRDIKDDVLLASISGGTDICSCFVTGNPNLPVWRGEIQCRGLGMAVDVFDDSGRSVREQRGELVCTQSFPAMPVGFYNDPDGKRYRAAYFERFPGVWCHGDFCELTAHGGMIIYGRSDSVLNPGGVRIGTAEIYREVEKLPQILESVAIAQEWQGDVRVVLFVKLRPGVKLDTALENQIRDSIRQNTTPRHVPAKILGVDDIPRTRSGKIVEIAVREAVHGRPVKNIEALANPESLEFFRNRPELQEP